MLTNRQLKILEILTTNENRYVSSNKISEMMDISQRTVKTEINQIKKTLTKYPGVDLISIASKGYLLKGYDKNFLNIIRNQQSSNVVASFNEHSIRIKYLLLTLLNTNNYVKRNTLINKMSVSESTLYLDLKDVKDIVNNYNLQLLTDSGKGYIVKGSEENKRRCLIHENVFTFGCPTSSNLNIDYNSISKIKEILIEVFLKYEFKISEELLESLIMHLLLIIDRISKGYILDYKPLNEEINEDIYNISTEILNRCLPINKDIDSEICNFYLQLKGRCEFEDVDSISEEVIDFINNALNIIKIEFGVDLTNDVNLKVVLSLHFVPLLSRIKNNMQLKNIMLEEVKRSFPFAFDIAHFFGLLIFDYYHLHIDEDEVAFLTLYFNYGLENNAINAEGKRILIISSLKKSETFLLKQRILNWFKNQILEIKFINPYKLEYFDISYYDAIFTTDHNDNFTKGSAVHISLFPSEKDFAKINLAINGYDNINSILSKFSKDLFYRGIVNSREEIVNKLIDISNKQFDLPPKFKELVLEREALGSTYFANHIAMPHGLYPINNQTFIAVALLDKPILWDENQEVELVMLVSTEINNPKAFQIWPYLSSLVCDSEKVNQILKNKTYDNFIEILKSSLLDKF